MKLDRSEVKISLAEQEARVALAYLGENDTFRLLVEQVVDKAHLKGMSRVHISNYRTDAQAVEIENTMRAEAPELFTYEVSYDHRAPLLGAFVLGAEGQEPSRTDMLEGIESEQVIDISATARDSLLALR